MGASSAREKFLQELYPVGIMHTLAKVKRGGEAVAARSRKGDQEFVEPIAQCGFLR